MFPFAVDFIPMFIVFEKWLVKNPSLSYAYGNVNRLFVCLFCVGQNFL